MVVNDLLFEHEKIVLGIIFGEVVGSRASHDIIPTKFPQWVLSKGICTHHRQGRGPYTSKG